MRIVRAYPRFFTFLLLFAALCARSHSRIGQPEMWAEDGTVYLADFINIGPSTILSPFAGVYLVLERLFVYVPYVLLPLRFLPLAITLIYIAFFSFVFGSLVSKDYEWLIPNAGLRALLALALCFAPGLQEMLGNTSGLFWVFYFYIGILGLKAPTVRFRWWEMLLAVLCLFSTASSILLFPLFVWRAFLARKEKDRRVVFQSAAMAALFVVNVLLLAAAKQAEYFLLTLDHVRSFPKVFTLTSFRSFVLQPFLGDKLAILITNSESVLHNGGVFVLALLLVGYFFGTSRNRAPLITVLLFGVGTLFWTMMNWIGRPGGMWMFSNPLDLFFFYMRYSFPSGVAAVIFWYVFFNCDALPRRRATVISVIFASAYIGLSNYRWSIKPVAATTAWESGHGRITHLIESGQPGTIRIQPRGWSIEVKSRAPVPETP